MSIYAWHACRDCPRKIFRGRRDKKVRCPFCGGEDTTALPLDFDASKFLPPKLGRRTVK
jgi:hypothetical protein